ncbi:MAG TPA: UPF0182 family protein [Streptosporangiaceae bacterium]
MAFRAPGRPPAARRQAALARWQRRLITAFVAVVALIVASCVGAGIWTDLLWFRSVGHAGTFETTFAAKWTLFGVAAGFMVLMVGGNTWLAYRLRPALSMLGARTRSDLTSPLDSAAADGPPGGQAAGRLAADLGSPEWPAQAWRPALDSHRRAALAVLVGVTGLIAGVSATRHWQTWLLFANRTSFGRKDPQFGLDISFFVFDYPFIRLVLTYLFAGVLVALLAATSVHLLYGGLAPSRRGERATVAARTQLFVLAGVFVLLKAGAYWTDRYGIDFSQHNVVQTGASYTDVNAILPAKTVLAVIAVICAALFLVGAARRSSMLPAIGLGLLVLSAVLLGGVYPAVVQEFVVKPNELAKQAPFLDREIAGTRRAYGLAGAQVVSYPASPAQPAAEVAGQAAALPDLRLADPAVMSAAFQQLQQVKSYYEFPPVLSVDRYQVPGSSVPLDMIIGVREMRGPPAGQAGWVNTHLVYTHGYGVVAADAGTVQPSGSPVFTQGSIPESSGVLGRFQPRVYFGEQESSYVIAGGRGQRELDYPGGTGGGQSDSTYHGLGGVPIGSPPSRLLYAIKFRQLNILLSAAINNRSRILYIRDPLARVAKVAPFLTLDADPYPVVIGHQLDWVVDGYTDSNDYPYSARIGLRDATSDSYAPRGGVTGPGGQVNYLRNSVKAVVNAYTGQVTLYQWTQGSGRDPVLADWEKAFPRLIRPSSAIPTALRAQLRYPEALLEVQRQILTEYHETSASAFYAGQDFWSLPTDPASIGHGRLQPPYYLTLAMPGRSQPEFSLVTSFTQRYRPNLAAILAVNSDTASPDYGRLEILQLPQDAGIAGPQQAHTLLESDTTASADLALWRKGGAKVTFGNLITVPVGGGLLYTQPVYVSARAGDASYPALTRVFAYYDGQVGYAPTLAGAVDQALGTTSGQAGSGPPGTLSWYLEQARTWYAGALTALRGLHWAQIGTDLTKMNEALTQASRLAGGTSGGSSGGLAPAVPATAGHSGR